MYPFFRSIDHAIVIYASKGALIHQVKHIFSLLPFFHQNDALSALGLPVKIGLGYEQRDHQLRLPLFSHSSTRLSERSVKKTPIFAPKVKFIRKIKSQIDQIQRMRDHIFIGWRWHREEVAVKAVLAQILPLLDIIAA